MSIFHSLGIFDKRQHTKPRRKHTFIFISIIILITVFTGHYYKSYTQPRILADMLGYVLVIICVLGRTYSSLFVAGKKNEHIVTQGMYSVVRNPLYVFSFVGVVGIGLQSGKITILIILVTAFILYYQKVIMLEEAYLTEKFGSEYIDYTKITPRWIPNFKQWNLPDNVTVKPALIQRTATDAIIFCLPYLLFQCIEMLQHVFVPMINVM